MDTLKLLITDNAFILTEKGVAPVEKTFSIDGECFALLSAELAKHKKKARIECLFSGSRLVIKSLPVRYAHPETFSADDKTLQLLVESAAHSFLEDHKEEKLDIICKEVVGLSLNGYPVKAIKKQKVTDLCITVFISALHTEYKKHLLEALGRFGDQAIFLPFAQHQMELIAKTAEIDDFITCSVYEHSTDLVIRKNGAFAGMSTIPVGTRQAEEYISKSLPLDSFQKSLDQQIGAALIALCDGISLPSKVFLLVAPAYREAFGTAFKSDSYHAICFSEKGFEVTDMKSILKA